MADNLRMSGRQLALVWGSSVSTDSFSCQRRGVALVTEDRKKYHLPIDMTRRLPWNRWICLRDKAIRFEERGYPEEPGGRYASVVQPDCVALESVIADRCAVLYDLPALLQRL